MKELLVVGGGFAGLWAALTAARESLLHGAQIKVTLLNRDEFTTIRPRLYEPFTPAMRVDLRPVLSALEATLITGEVTILDPVRHVLHYAPTGGGAAASLSWDALVLAGGSVQRPMPIPGARDFAFDVDTFHAAERLSKHLATLASLPESPAASTFVVIGAGFTGIELAAELRRHLRALGANSLAEAARVVLVERAAVPGPALGAGPRPVIEAALAECRVELKLATEVAAVSTGGVTLAGGEHIECRTVIVTSGLMANALGEQIPGARDELGRLVVDAHLQVPALPGVFAAGDMAHAHTDDTHTALMSCQHAVPMGKMAGYNAARHLLGLSRRDYAQPNYVTCLDLGDAGAVLTQGWEREVLQSGPDVKALKRTINTQWIYPPTGGREAVMAAADLDAPWPPPA